MSQEIETRQVSLPAEEDAAKKSRRTILHDTKLTVLCTRKLHFAMHILHAERGDSVTKGYTV